MGGADTLTRLELFFRQSFARTRPVPLIVGFESLYKRIKRKGNRIKLAPSNEAVFERCEGKGKRYKVCRKS